MDRGSNKPTTDYTVPIDLLAVSSVAVGAVLLAVTLESSTSPMRIVLGIVLVLFAPGYALVSLLFPASTLAPTETDPENSDDDRMRVTDTERIVLSIGSSVVIVPLLGFVINYTHGGIRPLPMVVSIGAVTLVLSVLAVARRMALSPSLRYKPLDFGGLQRPQRRDVISGPRRKTFLNVGLVVGLLLAVAGVGVVLATTDNGEQYTEFYLLGEDQETGELVADEYPTELIMGEETEMYVGITNQERESVTYTVVVQLERIEGEPDDRTVAERSELDRFELTLEHGETWERERAIEPTLAGEQLRLTYLLFADSPPEDPGTDSAYRNLHVWVDVPDPDEDS